MPNPVRRLKRSLFAVLSAGVLLQATTCSVLDATNALTQAVLTSVITDFVFGLFGVLP